MYWCKYISEDLSIALISKVTLISLQYCHLPFLQQLESLQCVQSQHGLFLLLVGVEDQPAGLGVRVGEPLGNDPPLAAREVEVGQDDLDHVVEAAAEHGEIIVFEAEIRQVKFPEKN